MHPRIKPGGDDLDMPLLLVEKLVKEYPRQGASKTLAKLFGRKPPVEPDMFRAVDGISFAMARGESVGLVGESGCGKSTTSMMVMRLLDQTSGRIMFDGEEIGAILPNAFARLPLRKRIQMVFQDPTDSLNPRFTAARAIADPLLQLGGIKGRLQRLNRAIEPPGNARDDLEILRDLIGALSGADAISSVEEVFKQMSEEFPAFAGLSLGKIGDLGIQMNIPQP